MLRFVCLVVLCGAVACQEWQLVFEDEFDGNSIDLTKWDHEITATGGGNNEFQVYTDDPANSYVKDGKLFLRATPLSENINPLTGEPFGEEFLNSGTLDVNALYGRCTNNDGSGCYRIGLDIPPTMSARLRSADRFAYKFGRAEIRAKMPVGDWLWPAIWMLPEHWVYGGWPLSGEIDIIESIGNPDLKFEGTNDDAGIQKMGSTTHWGVAWNQNRYYLTTADLHNADNDFGNYFHDFVVEWDENSIRWYVDGHLLLQVPDPPVNENPGFNFYDFGAPWSGPPQNPWSDGTSMAPFDEAFHLLFNVAVGGTNWYIPDNVVNRGNNELYGKPWVNGGGQRPAMNDFWNARDRWLWTWRDEGDNNAMQVEYVRVYQRA